MKVSNSTPNYIHQTYTNQANKPASQNLKSNRPEEEPGNGIKADSINFSDQTRELQRVSKAMETEPAGREKYVADIKQQVQANQYTINADAVAEKMAGFLLNRMV